MQLMELFDEWTSLSMHTMTLMTPSNFSVAQIHQFVNTVVARGDEDPALQDSEEEYSDEELAEVNSLTDYKVLRRGLKLEAVKKRGRSQDRRYSDKETTVLTSCPTV